jgi:AdoMet-dependent rRNA methyltransferase SPB1
LTLSALKLAVELLGSGGTFVTKVFRSKDYNNLLWVFQQLFRRVEATKPPSSRNVSAEIFVVCSDFLAPKKLDPKFLDPRYVFKELDPAEFASDSTNRFSSKAALNDLLFPERASNKRKREGYEDGATTLRQTDTVASFIRAKESEAMVMLAKCHEIVWDVDEDTVIDDEDDETENLPIDLISIRKHPSTSDEIVECLKDLRVLGRKDFKVLLRWRKAIRKDILESKASNAPSIPDVEMEEAVDEEGKMLEELDALTEQLTKEERRAKKKRQVKIAKEQRRLQLNMIAPKEIGIEGAQEADVFVDDIATEIEAESDGKLFQLRGIAKPSLDQIDQADIDDHDLPSECEYTDFSSEGEEDTDDEDHHLGCLAQEMDEEYVGPHPFLFLD